MKDQNFFSLDEAASANLEADLMILSEKFSANDKRIAQSVDAVINKYAETHRHYHNLSHVNNILSETEKLGGALADGESVRLAIWFHDVIYQPKKQNNEAKSAKFAAAYLNELKFPRTVIEKVERMILATHQHDADGLDFDGKLFLDLDLGILGAKPDIYRHYKQAIRREYLFVPWFLYRRSRAKILTNFLKREFIYFTDEMREKFEAAARANVADEIKELS